MAKKRIILKMNVWLDQYGSTPSEKFCITSPFIMNRSILSM